MIRLLDIYQQQFKISLAVQFQYRFGMMIWMIEVVLSPLIFLVVWQSAAGSGSVGGYTGSDFAAYFIVLLVVTHFTQMWHMWEYEYLIRMGEMNIRLLRPVHPIHGDVAQNIAFKVFMLLVVIPAVVVMSLLFNPVLNPPVWALIAFLPSVILAGAVAFLTGWVVAMAAFWTTRIVAINQVYFLSMLFFSGQLAPLSLLPPVLQDVANVLPFRWIISFPTEMTLGRLSGEEALLGFGMQLLWLVISLVLLRVVWRQAVRQYSAVGG